MTAFAVTLLRFGFLALIWVFVLFVVFTLRRDVYGIRVRDRAKLARTSGRVDGAAAGMKAPAMAAAGVGSASGFGAGAAGAAGAAAGAGAAGSAAAAGTGAAGAAAASSTGAAASPSSISALVVTAGSLAGTSLPLRGNQMIIGRSPDCALVLDDSFSSARHARLFYVNNQWWIEDLNSTNGTVVGGVRIEEPMVLQERMPITIGKTTMELRR